MTETRIDYLRVIDVHGEDAGDFLQSQFSSDVSALAVGDCGFTCYCTPRGQVIALLLVCRTEGAYHLVCAADLVDAVLQRLRLYVMRSRAEFTAQEDTRVWSSAGPSAGNAFAPPETGLVYRFGPNDDSHAPLADWKARELAAGVLWLGQASSEQFIPQMLGFEALDALSFSKGCYPGQEIVARARYLGKVKRGVRRLRLEQPVELNAMDKLSVLRDGEWSAARVMDSVVDSQGRTALIVQCTREPDSEIIEIETDGRTYRSATM